MGKLFLAAWVMALVFFTGASASAAVALNENAPSTYTVKQGDTLWSISEMYLKHPWRWPELWDVNPQIDNPHRIFPGDRLRLEWVDGAPRLRLLQGRDVKWSPSVSSSPLDLAIPPIPLDEIGAFLRRHQVLSLQEIKSAAYIVAGNRGHLISASGDIVFGRGFFPDGENAYGIYRSADVYREPLTQEILGYQARDIGSAQIRGSNRDDVVKFEINRITEEVREGDLLIPQVERVLDSSFVPKAPDMPVIGAVMIAVDGGVSQIGTLDVVVVNQGLDKGLEPGDVLAIFQAGAVVRDDNSNALVALPDQRAGLMMIFDVFDRTSYGLVLKADRPLKIMDRLGNP